jgi:hypothetical protein
MRRFTVALRVRGGLSKGNLIAENKRFHFPAITTPRSPGGRNRLATLDAEVLELWGRN